MLILIRILDHLSIWDEEKEEKNKKILKIWLGQHIKYLIEV